MAGLKPSTRAFARNLPNVSRNPQWLGALALALALSAVPAARADTITNRIYPSDPTQWTLYQGATLGVAGSAIAPDGTATTPIQGASGTAVQSGVIAKNAVPAGGGEIDTFSVYYRYMLGAHPNAHLCMNGVLLGQASDQCLTFNAVAGSYVHNDPGIIDYTVAPVGSDGWLRVSIVFKTAIGGMAAPSITGNNGQIFAVWGAQFESGPYPGKLIPTTTAAASGVNQINPVADNLNQWAGGGFVRQSGTGVRPVWLETINGIVATSTPLNTAIGSSPVTYYFYSYVNKQFNVAGNMQLSAPYPGSSCSWGALGNLGPPSRINFVVFPTNSMICQDFPHAAGSFDAGDDVVLWLAVTFPAGLNVYFDEGLLNSAVGRTAIQAGGVFP